MYIFKTRGPLEFANIGSESKKITIEMENMAVTL